jgi:hypothetical protein
MRFDSGPRAASPAMRFGRAAFHTLQSSSRQPVNQRSAQLHHDSIRHDPHAIDRGIVKSLGLQ